MRRRIWRWKSDGYAVRFRALQRQVKAQWRKAKAGRSVEERCNGIALQCGAKQRRIGVMRNMAKARNWRKNERHADI